MITSFALRREDEIPRSQNNVLVPISADLYEYAKKLAKEDWDPNTPRLTEHEARLLECVVDE